MHTNIYLPPPPLFPHIAHTYLLASTHERAHIKSRIMNAYIMVGRLNGDVSYFVAGAIIPRNCPPVSSPPSKLVSHMWKWGVHSDLKKRLKIYFGALISLFHVLCCP